MLSTAPLLETSLEGLSLNRRGKVRDVYEIALPSGEPGLLIVATDRISAFDYVLGSGIPDKGKVLTQLSGFWFERIGDLVPHHLISLDVEAFPDAARRHADTLRGRTMLARRTEPVPIECVARGYLSGSGWKEYQQTGSVCGVKLPAGLRESDRLPEPIFTPATKADTGHDVNISEDEAAKIIGRDLTSRLKEIHTPILIIVGEDDPGTPVAMSKEIHENAPGSKLVVLPKAAHLSNIEQSAAFNRALDEFLKAH